ncbi:MAG: hypothetical protein LQ342_001824 [Letrouitia transgressa]|nr:MAG: hypothetical protein LQ342_001824 [Letrouitia transgressa]
MATLTSKPIGPIGYGMMNLTWRQTPIPDTQAFATLRAGLAAGCNFWNGGEIYGTPDLNSLTLLNRYFTQYPEDASKVVLSIKGCTLPGQPMIDGSAKNVRRSVEDCLKALDGKKKIDIFEAARVDQKVPLQETIGTLADCVKEGKIGGIGLSEVTADQIQEAAKIHPIAAVEVELSLHTLDILQNGVATTCGKLGIPIIAYSPLGRGLLTTQIRKTDDIDKNDIRHHLPRFAPGALEKNARFAEELKKLAEKKGCTAAQVALGWVRSRSGRDGAGVIIPIPGSTTVERVEENAKIVVLSEEELKELQDITERQEVVGARYPTQWS